MITLSLGSVKLEGSAKIIAKRGLQKGGPVSLFFASEVARQADIYVPMRTGTLKRTITIAPGSVTYRQNYAKDNYEHNAGWGNQGVKRGGKRGPRWGERMWADRGADIVRGVAKMAGGRPG